MAAKLVNAGIAFQLTTAFQVPLLLTEAARFDP